MKKLFLVFAFLAALSFLNLAQDRQHPYFGLNDSAFVKIVAENIHDTIIVEPYYFSLIPYRGFEGKHLSITKPGVYHLSYAVCRPEMIYNRSSDVFQALLIPGDTIELKLGYEKDENSQQKIHIEAIGEIQQYYDAKFKKFGFNSLRDERDLKMKSLPSSGMSLADYSIVVRKIDTLVNLANEFLEQHKQALPEWFVEMETADITYSSELFIKRLFLRLNKEEKRKIFYINPEIDNPKAVYSNFYYEFLDEFLFEKIFQFDTAVSRSDISINRLKRLKPYVDSLLSGRIKENYLAYKLSDSYFFCSNITDVKKVEAYINSNFPDLNEEHLKFINALKYRNIKLTLSKDSKAPGFYLKDTNDKFKRLSDFKDKVVYLNFWSVTDEKCKKEFPAINKLYSKMKGKPFEIINICLNNDVEKWKQIIEKEKLMGTNLICKGNWGNILKTDYFVEEIPHFTLIGKEGKVIENKTSSPGEIDKEINAYLKY